MLFLTGTLDGDKWAAPVWRNTLVLVGELRDSVNLSQSPLAVALVLYGVFEVGVGIYFVNGYEARIGLPIMPLIRFDLFRLLLLLSLLSVDGI